MMRKVILEVGEKKVILDDVWELLILEDVGWEWIILYVILDYFNVILG